MNPGELRALPFVRADAVRHSSLVRADGKVTHNSGRLLCHKRPSKQVVHYLA